MIALLLLAACKHTSGEVTHEEGPPDAVDALLLESVNTPVEAEGRVDVTFEIDAGTGGLTRVGHTPTGGSTPRHFSIDPTGTLLFAANQASGTVFAFRIDGQSGALTSLGQVASVSDPQWVGALYLP